MESGIRKVGVIGIGLMGSGIAQIAATRGFDTLVVDLSPELLEEGMMRIRESLQRLVESHKKSAVKPVSQPKKKERFSAGLRIQQSARHCSIRTSLSRRLWKTKQLKRN